MSVPALVISLANGFRSTLVQTSLLLLNTKDFVVNEDVSEFCVPQINISFPQIKVAYKKDAKENLHYTTVADRPDIKKATQAAKQASEVRVP